MIRPIRHRGRWIAAVVTALAATSGVVGAPVGAAPATDLFISEYVEGTGNNQALEIFNGTGVPIDLAAGNYRVSVWENGLLLQGARFDVALVGTIAPGDAFVLVNAGAAPALLALADQVTNVLSVVNGNDPVALSRGALTLDSLGQVDLNPSVAQDRTLRRKPTVHEGDGNVTDAFDPALEWLAYPADTFDGLGSHTIVQETGSVSATVTVSAGACLQLSTTTVSFGTLALGAANQPATPDFTVTNCAGAPESLLASGTDATGPGALWMLDDTAQTCTSTPPLALDRYHLFAGINAGVPLSTANKTIGFLPAGGTISQRLGISTACPGSTGSGKTMSMQVNYLATG